LCRIITLGWGWKALERIRGIPVFAVLSGIFTFKLLACSFKITKMYVLNIVIRR
jgi:hypothetical protein